MKKSLSVVLPIGILLVFLSGGIALAGMKRITSTGQGIDNHGTSSDGIIDFSEYRKTEWCEIWPGFGEFYQCTFECWQSVALSTGNVQATQCWQLDDYDYFVELTLDRSVVAGNHSRLAYSWSYSGPDYWNWGVSSINQNFTAGNSIFFTGCNIVDMSLCPDNTYFYPGDISYNGYRVIWTDLEYNVFISDYGGTNFSYIANSADIERSPRMDDLGDRAVFNKNDTQICAILTDGTGENCFTPGEGCDISNDGNSIFFTDIADNLYRANFDGTGITSVLTIPSYGFALNYAADKIAFISNSNPLGTNPDGNYEVFRANGDGNGIEQITQTVATNMTQVYISGDGQSTTWLNSCNEQVYLYRDDITTAQPSILSVSPSSRNPGTTSDIYIYGDLSHFLAGSTMVSFSGTGITVNNVTVQCDGKIKVNITVASNAPLGSRNLTATTGAEIVASTFLIAPLSSDAKITNVTPSTGSPGQTGLWVTITGENTHFSASSVVTFTGGHITVTSKNVISSTEIQARISISPSASFYYSDVTVTTGSEVATARSAFWMVIDGMTPALSTAMMAALACLLFFAIGYSMKKRERSRSLGW